MREDDDYLDKALEGFAMFALNQGEVCTCPSRALVHEKIYDRFMEKAIKRVEAVIQGDPLAMSTMIGAQASSEQLEKILSYIDIGKQEGAEVLTGGYRNQLPGELSGGYYVKPTVFRGHNKMRIFQEEIFGPVVSVTTFKDEAEALEIANDTLYGLGAVCGAAMPIPATTSAATSRRSRLDELLPRLSGACGLRGLQAVGHWSRDAQDDARSLPADQEHAGVLQPQGARFLLSPSPGAVSANAAPIPPLPALDQEEGFFVLTSVGKIMTSGDQQRVVATEAALAFLAEIKRDHPDILFHQSGGCCDGSSPMCYPASDYRVGETDVKLGEIGGVPFYISGSQYAVWAHTQLIIDVVPGRGGMFSLDNGRERRFLTRSRLFAGGEACPLPGM